MKRNANTTSGGVNAPPHRANAHTIPCARARSDRGIHRLYSHQAEAFELIRADRNVVVVTPTASGKTLCYNLPVLNLVASDPGARALYLFPTKALAEDQLHQLQTSIDQMGSEIRAFTYDGDTPQDARKAIRQRANIVWPQNSK